MEGVTTASDSPLMKAFKRDLIWLKESSALYSHINNDFVTTYFLESSKDVVEGHTNVRIILRTL